MVADLRGVLVGELAVHTLEGVRHREVVGLQARKRQRRERPLPYQVVREAIRLLARGRQEVAARGLVERVAQLMAGELAECLEQRDVEIAADDPGRHQHALCRLAQPLDPAPDEPAHALRQLEVLFGVAGLRARAAEHALRLRHVEEGVLDEQRVAFGGRLDAEQLDRRQGRFRHAGDDPLDVLVGETVEDDTLGAAAPEQARHHRGKRPAGVELRVPASAENDDAASDHALGEIAQEHDGCLVRPLQVVEHDQERLVALDCGQQGVDSLEQLLPDLVRGNFVHGAHAADLLTQHGGERRQQWPVVADGFVQDFRCCVCDRTGEHVAEGSVRCPVFFEAAPGQDEPTLGGRLCGDLRREPRRADARGASEEEERAVAHRRAVHDHADVEPLLLAVDETVVRSQNVRRFFHLTRCDLVQAPAVGESLQLVAAADRELHLGGRSDKLTHDVRDEDLAPPGLAGDACRHVDRGAEDVTGLLHHLARVEADADPELPPGVLLAVVGDRTLDVESALDAMTRRAEADHEAVAEALDPAPGVLGDLLVDDRLVRPHDLVRGGEASRRQEACRLLDVGEHDRDRALRLADRKAADDRFRGQRRRGVDRLSQPLRDLTQQALRRAEARFALRVPDGLEQSGLGREAKLSACRVLADLGLRRVVARLQLGAFERFRERRREAQA